MTVKKIVLFFLIIVGFLLRYLYQPEVPYGFHRDEAGIAYSAYSVLKTGKDEWGNFLPLHFKALGDYPPGIYNYLVVASIPFFGLSEMAERFPAILIGTLLIPLSYLFVKRFFKNDRWALLTSFFVTFSPWMVVQSRAGSEALAALFFSLVGFLFFERWVKNKKIINLLSLLLFYFLAFYSYNATRVVLPLLHFSLLFFFWNKIKPKFKRKQIILGGVILLFSLGSVFLTQGRRMSFENTSVFTNTKSVEALQVIFNREGINGLPIVLSRVFTNKYTNLVLTFTNQYLDYFDTSFIFNDGGFHKRYLVPGIGPIMISLLPLILVGFIKGKLSKKEKKFLLIWILLAPLGGAITTVYVPNIKRSMYMFFPLLLLAAVGFDFAFSWFKSKKVFLFALGFFSLLYFWNLGYFLKQYLVHTKYETTKHRSYGYKEAFNYTRQHENEYKKVKVYEGLDTPHTFYLFYSQYSPKKYQMIPNNEKRDLFLGDRQVVDIGKYEFNPNECPDHLELESESLYLLKYGCFNEKILAKKMKVLEVISGPDKMPIFYLSRKIDSSTAH